MSFSDDIRAEHDKLFQEPEYTEQEMYMLMSSVGVDMASDELNEFDDIHEDEKFVGGAINDPKKMAKIVDMDINNMKIGQRQKDYLNKVKDDASKAIDAYIKSEGLKLEFKDFLTNDMLREDLRTPTMDEKPPKIKGKVITPEELDAMILQGLKDGSASPFLRTPRPPQTFPKESPFKNISASPGAFETEVFRKPRPDSDVQDVPMTEDEIAGINALDEQNKQRLLDAMEEFEPLPEKEQVDPVKQSRDALPGPSVDFRIDHEASAKARRDLFFDQKLQKLFEGI